MIAIGKTYQFTVEGKTRQGKIKDQLVLGDGRVWVTFEDDSDYIVAPEEMKEL